MKNPEDFKNKLDAFEIVKIKRNGLREDVYFKYYETPSNLLTGILKVYFYKTAGIGRLFGKGNLALQELSDLRTEFEVEYTGKNRPLKQDTNNTIFELYIKKRHPVVALIRNHKDAKRKYDLDYDFQSESDDDLDDDLENYSDE